MAARAVEVPLVYNPASGSGRGEARALEAIHLFARHQWHLDPRPTQGPGDAIRLTQQLADEGHRTILVMGGDGTLSEAADGLLRSDGRKKVRLGFLPGGTGNDFLRDFAMDPLGVAVERVVACKKPRPIDAALVEWTDEAGNPRERHFINVFGTGLAAHATDFANRRLKWMGRFAYTAAVLPELGRLNSAPTRLVVDGKTIEEPMALVLACNNVYTGGDMKIAPMARPDDGWLDVVALRTASRRRVIALLRRVFSGTHMDEPEVAHWRAKEIEIDPEVPSPLLGDGEIYGGTPCRIHVVPGALQLLL
ncbi:MAG: diacylglycerol/lipid kinase family protein [Thermoplasmatota archaeon]